MPNFELSNDWVLIIPIHVTTATGVVVPAPAGDTFTVVSSDPASLAAVVGADASGNPIVTVNALVDLASNITVTLTDSTGLVASTAIFDIVADTTATSVLLDLSDATHTPQPVPAATPVAPTTTTTP